jgi:hypothetical protein
MGKKPNTKTVKAAAKSGKNSLWLVLGGSVIMIGLVWMAIHMTSSSSAESQSNKPPVSLISTLSPENYTGRARLAYQAAKDIPEILAQLPCFCGCMDSLGHHNNLYCFADSHGSICDVCQSIALNAQEMHRKGIPVETIRDNIRAAYDAGRL